MRDLKAVPNQCDGCQRGIRAERDGDGKYWVHRDPHGNWWNSQICTAHRYGAKPHGAE